MPVIRFIGLPQLTPPEEEELIYLCYGAVRNVPNFGLATDLEKSVSVLISNDRLPSKQFPVVFIEVFGLILKPCRHESDRQLLADNLVIVVENFIRRLFPDTSSLLIECAVAPYIFESQGFASILITSKV